MSFLHPEFLYYMLPPLFILFALLMTQKGVEAHFFSEEVIQKLRVNVNTLSLKERNAIFFLIGILIIIALSGPIIKEGTVQIKAKSADIMIALDISDSMLAEDVYPNRLRFAKQKAIDLINMAPNERVGVLAFAKNSYLVSPLSFDHGAVNFLLSQLDTTSITQKGTDIGSLLEVVDSSIKNDAKKYLLLLSDGSDADDFSKEIAFAKEKNIVVFVLGIGTTKGAPIKLQDGSFIKHNGEIIVSKLNEAIAKLAVESGGVYIENVKSQEDIKTMLSEIEKIGEQKELKSEEVARFIPLFYYPLGLALLLLLIATSSMSKRIKVALPSAFLLFGVLVAQPNAEAGILDFMELKKAKEAYANADFAQSAELYAKHAQATQNAQSYFNAGNSLYKQEKYEEALKAYESAHFQTKQERAKNYANIGNTNAKLGSEENLQNALKAYEESLKLQKDKEVEENYAAVKKALQEQNEEQKEEDKEKNKENKQEEKQNKQEEEKQEQQQQDKDKEGEKGLNDEKQNSQEKKDSQNQEESQKQEDSKKQESQDSKTDEQKQEQKKQEESPKNEKKNSETMTNDTKAQEKNEDAKEDNSSKEDLKQLSKEKEDTQKSPEDAVQTGKEKMSDAEEEKWIHQLNMNQNSYMYMLNDENKNEEKTDEKPW
jgi:Ca-activated chloride channel family protein